MLILFAFFLILSLLTIASFACAENSENHSEWTVYITNDNCPDYTWGFTEEQTRQSFADIVSAHLDEMKHTDGEALENRDRYNMAVTQEALCFLERYPTREEELIRRIKEGRIYVSPYLCNSLWAFQSVESAIRTFYPARRLEREWSIPIIDVAEHIEEPSLPCGVASILSGCGIRWLSNPFLSYDSTFGELKNLPIFIIEGRDGSQIKVIMDSWASLKSNYTQGSKLLRNPDLITTEWLAHYQRLGDSYPIRIILASGTHGDISPQSGDQAHDYAEAIINYNKRPDHHPKLANAILPQFCDVVDEAQKRKPFLTTIRGCFGHSWDLWPLCLAKYVADMREGERKFIAAEALITVASQVSDDIADATRAERERAEWCLAMLSDHAWNGTDENNKRHNAELRRKWSEELNLIDDKLTQKGWPGLGVAESHNCAVIFNSLSMPRVDLVRLILPSDMDCVSPETLKSQIIIEDNERVIYFVPPEVPGFWFRQMMLKPDSPKNRHVNKLRATTTELESPYYQLKIDQKTGGISSLIHKVTAAEIVNSENGRTLCQTVYFDSHEHTLKDVESEVISVGSVLARLRITGNVNGIDVTNYVTVYTELDRVDFDLRVNKPVTSQEERLCHVFPVMRNGAILRVETTGAITRPFPQPNGDLLPGADTRRFAVQRFADASRPDDFGVTIAPLDSFALRTDLDLITFEALGNDQNYREVIKNQNRVTNFRFRYSLRAHVGGYNGSEAFAWSRSVATPLLAKNGIMTVKLETQRNVDLNPARAIATCLKPADDDSGGYIMRIWETAGQSGAIRIRVNGYRRAFLTDLLERDIRELEIVNNRLEFDLHAFGFAGLRLLP